MSPFQKINRYKLTNGLTEKARNVYISVHTYDNFAYGRIYALSKEKSVISILQTEMYLFI